MSSFKSKLLNGFAWRLCLYISSFVLNIFIANNFQAEHAGTFYLLMNNIAFVVLFLSLGLDSAISYFGSRKEISAATLLMISICWTLFACALLAFSYRIAINFHSIGSHPLAPWILLNAGCTLLANCTSSILFAQNDNQTPNFVFTVINILLVLLLPGNGLTGPATGHEYYTKIYLAISSLPAIVFVLYLFVKNPRKDFSLPQRSLSVKMFQFSMQAFIYSVLYMLLLRCDYWLVNYFCNADDLGNYMQATKISQIILLVPTLASFALFPLIVSHIHEEKAVADKLIKLVSIYFYVGLTMCAVVIATGYWIFPLLYGPTFSRMYGSFVLLSPGILMLAAAYPLSTYFSGKNMIRVKITALTFSILLLLALDLVLIPQLNIFGAAISGTIVYVFYFAYLLFKFRQSHPFKLVEILKPGPIIRQNIQAILKSNAGEKN